MNVMHKRIKRFFIEGEIHDDAAIPRLRENYANILNTQMRLEGYAPRIDIDQDFSISYTGHSYNFILSIYGSYIGKKSAECIEAIDHNKPIYTPKAKSEKSLKDQV